MRITGLDLGIGKMGLCTIDVSNIKPFKKLDIVSMKTFQLDKKSKSINKFEQFILTFEKEIATVIGRSDMVVVEKPFGLRGYANILYELLGVVKYLCITSGVSRYEISPMTLKKFATGSGKAQKSDIVLKAFKEFGVEGNSEDEIDALYCALIGDCVLSSHKYSIGRIAALKNIVNKN